MNVNLTISDYKLREIFEKELNEKVRVLIMPKIVEELKRIDQDKILEAAESLIIDTLNNKCWLSENVLSDYLDDKISAVISNMDDDVFKNMLLERLIKKVGI